MEKTKTKIIEKIKSYDKVCIFYHVSPDGDAFGSSFGLREIIKDTFKKDVYLCGDNVAYLNNFFGEVKENKDNIFYNSLGIVLDTPTRERIGDSRYSLCKELIKIDHHIFVEEYASVELINTEASSTCEIIALFSKEFDLVLSPKAATYLYFGLLTDTDRFLYSYDSETFEASKFLFEKGADVKSIYPSLYYRSFNDVKRWAYAQTQGKVTPNGVGYNKFYADEVRRLGYEPQSMSGLVNCLSDIKGIDAWVHFSEQDDGTVRVEIRSREIPVNQIANKYGGGGHKNACGCTLINMDECDLLLKDLDDLLFINKPYYKQFVDMMDAYNLAKKAILEVYHSQDLNVEIKDDNSPVTKGDKLSNKIITDYLSERYPEYGFLSEESIDDKDRLSKDYVFIIDPIDGTKDFIAKDDEFACNIALCYKHEIVCGICGIPALNKVYYAFKDGGAFKIDNGVTTRINVSNNVTNLIVLQSKYHVSLLEGKILDQYSALISSIKKVGSAYKSCLIAEGKANLNIKYGEGTKEWDIAPIVLIVKEAGGYFLDYRGNEFVFNRDDVYNHGGYVVSNRLFKEFIRKD